MTTVQKSYSSPGPQSHGWGAHEHYAGCVLLAKALSANLPQVTADVYRGGWPQDPRAFDGASAVVMYCDGGNGHMVNNRLAEVDTLMKRGVGLVCIHYAVEVPRGPSGDRFLDWIGGYFEVDWSVNPHWKADFRELPDHPITRGVRPFAIQDEWYYHMRFRDSLDGVTPILTSIPPDSTLDRRDGPRSGNRHVRAKLGQPQHVAWAYQRPDGGRGFGFTGGHVHANWGDDNFRKLVLNAIVWTARAQVPPGGVPSAPLTTADLDANQDEPKPEKKR